MADFEAEELKYAEEEMLEVVQRKVELQKKLDSGELTDKINADAIVRGYGEGVIYPKLDDSAPV